MIIIENVIDIEKYQHIMNQTDSATKNDFLCIGLEDSKSYSLEKAENGIRRVWYSY